MVHYSNDFKVRIIDDILYIYLGYFFLITGHNYEICIPCIGITMDENAKINKKWYILVFSYQGTTRNKKLPRVWAIFSVLLVIINNHNLFEFKLID